MTNLYPEASFLFGSEVEEYMNELGHKMNDLSVIRQLTQRNNCVLSPDEINKMKELDEWIYNAAMDGIRNKFSPYLNLGQWR